MESSRDSKEQLAEVDRLRHATRAESQRGRPWALPVLGVAIVVFLVSYLLDYATQRAVAPLIWIAFVAGWVVWLRSGNRARPRWFEGYDRRRDLPLLLCVLVGSGVLVILGATTSWAVAGVLMAVLAAGCGLFASLRARR